MRNQVDLTKRTSKIQTKMHLIGISGIALSLILLVLFIASCTKDSEKVLPESALPADVVAATIPANLADTVAIDPILTVNFKNGTISSDISTSKFILKQGTILIEGTVSYTATSASFKPDHDLMPDTRYTATVVTSFNKDRSGEDHEHEWSFKTGRHRHSTIPTIVSVIPLLKATSVPVSIQPSVIFSEKMDDSTINATTFTLFQGETKVAGTISYSGKTATFKPTSSLANNTEYIGTITTGVKNDNGTPLEYGYSWNFTTEGPLDVTPPTVISVVPANNVTGVAVSIHPTVTFSETLDVSTISSTNITFKQGATTITGTLSNSGTAVTFTPTMALAPNAVYTGTITGVRDNAGNTMASPYTWSFTTAAPADVTPPTVLSSVPANNATGIAVSSKPAVTFSEAMDASTINTTNFTLKQGTTAISGTVAYSGTTATFTPSATLAAGTVYSGTISGVKDVAGNTIASAYTWSFTTAAAAQTDVTPPTVSSAVPANNATGVAVGTKPAVTFSEAMTASTITTTTFTLKQGTTTVAGTVSYSGTTATFTPSAALAASTVYTGTITTGAKDAAGNAIASAYTWSFTTAAVADVTPPTVSSAVPANNATGVAASAKPAVTFSEAMTASTITTTTFTLKQGTTAVAGTVSYSGTTATFTPSAALAASTVYTGTVSGVKDAAGNTIAAAYTWSFTTAAAADVTPPTVSSAVPANNATGVAVSTKPAVTFSEAMDAASITTTNITLKQGTTTVAGTVSYSGTTATFTPSAALAASTVYTGTVSGVKDAAGNAIASAYTWSFTTAAPADVTPPTVSSVAPANSATGIATSSKVTANFSEAMTASTINTTTFTLKQGTTTVAGTVTYSGSTAIFTPSAALSGGLVYTATITTGAKDAAGNAMASNYSWSFTTAPAVVLVSFATQVFPIVQAKCMPCHGASSPSAGIGLTNYTQVKAIGINLDNSRMYGYMGVTAAEQTLIKSWLAQGSLNN